MLLHRLRRGGRQGTTELRNRISLFDQGKWHLLLQASHETIPRSRRNAQPSPGSDEDWNRKLAKAEQLAARGELSSASRLLRSNGVAPGTDATLHQLQDPELRPQQRLLDFPAEVLNYSPDEVVQLDKSIFVPIFGALEEV